MNKELFEKVATFIADNPACFSQGDLNIFIHNSTKLMVQIPPSAETPCGVVAIAIHLTGGFPKETQLDRIHSSFNCDRHNTAIATRLGISETEFHYLRMTRWRQDWYNRVGIETNHTYDEPDADEAVKILRNMVKDGVVDSQLAREDKEDRDNEVTLDSIWGDGL